MATFPCTSCGRFAFNTPTECFWCRRGLRLETPEVAPAAAAPVTRSIDDLRAIANSRPHRCAGFVCHLTVPGDRLMCDDHHAFLPAWVQIRLQREYNPRAVTAWPQELVEAAIRFTMTSTDRSKLVERVEAANQNDLFARASA